MKTIDIEAKEWFDKVNGNSYFSAEIILDFGLPSQSSIVIPFQYGYGDHYIDMANEYLQKHGIIPEVRYENGSREPLWRWCQENNVILRSYKRKNCLKRELAK